MINSQTIQTAMILAAGFGTRMKDLTRFMPKPLLSVGTYKLIDIAVLKLKNAGIKRIIINLHYYGQSIKDHILSSSERDIEFLFSRETDILGTGGGIANAEHFFRNETILVVNSDVLSDISLPEFFKFHKQKKAFASLCVKPSGDYRNYSLIRYDNNYHFKGILKINQANPSSDKIGIYTGYQILSPASRLLLRPVFSSVIDDLYKPALTRKKDIFCYIHNGIWIDMGNKQQYEIIHEKIKKGDLSINNLL